MNRYVELKRRQEKEVNEFPMFFAFSKEQFSEGMKKLGLEPDEKDKIYSIGGGGYFRKSDSEKFKAMLDKHSEEMQKEIIIDYLAYKLNIEEKQYSNEDIYYYLLDVLNKAKDGVGSGGHHGRRGFRKILID